MECAKISCKACQLEMLWILIVEEYVWMMITSAAMEEEKVAGGAGRVL